jgi:hypothetical protein
MEGTHKGYKYQLIDGFFILREINKDTKTAKCYDLWAILKEMSPTVLRLREEEKIRIIVHSLITNKWYEFLSKESWSSIHKDNLYEIMKS